VWNLYLLLVEFSDSLPSWLCSCSFFSFSVKFSVLPFYPNSS
jgi:hypothetical protein